MLFVGQHAMAGMVQAPLRHTYSSRHVAHYRLNGILIGEFGARALVAGRQGVPTIYLSGDDKAALEAEMFVPGIETTVVKWGGGRESARHLNQDKACDRIQTDVAGAIERADEIEPSSALEPPYILEIRFKEPISDESIRERWGDDAVSMTRIDSRTVHLKSDDIRDLPL